MKLSDVLRMACAEGVTVQLADLGEYGAHALHSEYDPCDRALRINVRMLRKIAEPEVADFLARAIAHELFHHREHCGRIARLHGREAREKAADRFARALLAQRA